MSYRTYIEDVQVFGNNECYPEWLEFIKSQGIEIDDEQCYEGEIHDFMGAMIAIEKIVMRLNKEREELRDKWNKDNRSRKLKSLFDFTCVPESIEHEDRFYEEHKEMDAALRTSLFDALLEAVEHSYAFMPYSFYEACKEKLVQNESFSTPGHFTCYVLKDGNTIHVKAS